MTVATAAVAVLPGIKMSCEEMGALRERLTCRTAIRHVNNENFLPSWNCFIIQNGSNIWNENYLIMIIINFWHDILLTQRFFPQILALHFCYSVLKVIEGSAVFSEVQ